LGSLLPSPGQSPRFAQLYIYDTENELSNRLSVFRSERDHSLIDESIISDLMEMFDDINRVVRSFRMVRDRIEQVSTGSLRLRLLGQRSRADRVYSEPASSEIAALIVGDEDTLANDRDIIVEDRFEGVKRISSLHPLYMAMQYPILFPFGEDGYREGILYENMPDPSASGSNAVNQRTTVSMLQYYSYLVQQRSLSCNTLLRGGRLLLNLLIQK
ncbi:MAG: hypothetical protein Q8807_03825, partial ['Waltheria sp.' little leaf phytoplasma]|nr:hypothetical protein ['Waltheria sp.' little leaf phytoplasma]